MEKLKMESSDMTQKNVDRIGALFPNVITEMRDEDGKLKKGINFELLKQELSGEVIDGEERYDFNWVGKKAAIIEGNSPIRKTLRPCIEESKDWETTENLYIEGDNLDALKLLQESYLNSIKLIYIDPPYNTGNDFIYNDSYVMSIDEYNEEIGYNDDSGNIQFKKNEKTNPRYHSDWCSMIYPRLKFAQNLLSEDGFIFISIDDNEIDNLKKICNEIFGEENHINTIAIKMSESTGVKMTHVEKKLPKLKEYILVYSKGKSKINPIYIPKENWDDEYKLVAYGVIKEELEYLKEIMNNDQATEEEIDKANRICGKIEVKNINLLYSETGANSEEEKLQAKYDNAWRIMRDVATTGGAKAIADQIRQKTDAKFFLIVTPQRKKYLIKNGYSETASQPRIKMLFADEYLTMNPGDFWGDIKTTGLGNEGEVPYKNGKKPLKMIERIITLATNEDSIILDFFAGSATTAHAVMKKNNEDNGKRKYIMIQADEDLDKSLEKATAENKKSIKEVIEFLDSVNKQHKLSEVGKERIRRAGKKIKTEIDENNGRSKTVQESKNVPDIGFRVLKVDSTSMKDVYYAANEYSQGMLAGLESNIKDDRTDLDLLYGVLLDWGLPLSLSHTIEEIDDISVHTVDDGSLVACFADKISENIVREIAQRQPLRVVFRDSSFANSPDKINVEEIFKLHAPNTSVKVI